MLEIILLVVNFVGILGLGWLVKTLKGAVEAQGKTIDAQGKTIEAQGAILTDFKDLSATMKRVLDSTDEPKMLERVKAYKEFVDKEKEAAITEMENKRVKGSQLAAGLIRGLLEVQFEIFSNLILYVPVEERRNFIDSLRLDGSPGLKDVLYKVAEGAKDLSSPEKRNPLLSILTTLGDMFPKGPPKLPERSGSFDLKPEGPPPEGSGSFVLDVKAKK